MLQSIRDHTQGWIAGVIISLVILSFAMWGIHSYLVGATDTTTVAKVNGVVLTKNQLNSAYQRLRRQVQSNVNAAYNFSPAMETELKQRALQSLVRIEVLRQGSLDDSFHVSTRQVDDFLENMPEFQVHGQFSMSRFNQLLAAALYNPGEFLDLIKTTLLIDQPRLGIVFSAFALPNEVESTLALVNQERDVDYLLLPNDFFTKEVGAISDDEVVAYYKQHQNDYKAPEKVSVDYLALSMKDLIAAVTVTDAALKTFYNENINSFTIPAQWNVDQLLIPLNENASDQEVSAAKKKADDIIDKLNHGTDFATAAKEFPANNAEKKSLTWVTLTQVSPELQKAVSELTSLGQLSAPIHTKNGFVVLKLIGVKASQVQPFDTVKDKAKEVLSRQQAEEKFAELRDKLANVTYEHPDSLDTAAKTLGLTVKTSSTFSQADGSDDISGNQKVRDAAFTNDVLNSQNNSDVIQVSPDLAIVLRIKSHTPATVLPLADVKQKIIDTLTAQKAEAKAEAMALEIKNKLQNHTAPDAIAQQYHFDWTKLGFIGRYATKVDSAILYTAFRTPRPQNGEAVYAEVKTPQGFAIVATHAIRDGSNSSNQPQYDVYAEQVQNSDAMLEYKLYVESLLKKAKITSNNENVGS